MKRALQIRVKGRGRILKLVRGPSTMTHHCLASLKPTRKPLGATPLLILIAAIGRLVSLRSTLACCRGFKRQHNKVLMSQKNRTEIETQLSASKLQNSGKDFPFCSTISHAHTHRVGPRVAIKDNGLWLGVAMAMERMKAAGRLELMFGVGDQRFFSGCFPLGATAPPL